MFLLHIDLNADLHTPLYRVGAEEHQEDGDRQFSQEDKRLVGIVLLRVLFIQKAVPGASAKLDAEEDRNSLSM